MPDYPNGVILYYILYKNETLILNTTGDFFFKIKLKSLIILYLFYLELLFTDFNIISNVTYSYAIQSFNNQGNVTSKPAYFNNP